MKKILFFSGIIISSICIFAILDFFGIICHNTPFTYAYGPKGIDVSHHQGNIDWAQVAATHRYTFAFLKATEGHDLVDDKFAQNWKEARDNHLTVGAYHFFSLRSSGHEQAQFFIAHVAKEPHTLPPVVDVEVDVKKNPEHVRNELQTFLTEVQTYYVKTPILYVTYDSYNAYVKNYFPDYPLWIRDVWMPPHLGNRPWAIWQYSERGRVAGIQGYVDVDVFSK